MKCEWNLADGGTCGREFSEESWEETRRRVATDQVETGVEAVDCFDEVGPLCPDHTQELWLILFGEEE